MTEVDAADPAFQNPSKGIGGFTTREKAEQFTREGWTVREDAGRGWRRNARHAASKARTSASGRAGSLRYSEQSLLRVSSRWSTSSRRNVT